jgi:hypothetical protein
MGCDIHMYVEYKKSVNNNLVWVNGDYFKPNPYFKANEDENQFSRMELHGYRNYELFSTLAGVRDYTNKIVPVAEPRGLPEDCTEYVNSEFERWNSDGHTHSWLTLKELKAYQSGKPILYSTGLVTPEDALKLDQDGTLPESWCQGTSNQTYVRREWSEENKSLIPLIEKLQARAKELMHYEWEEYDIENDENVRIVFWFDN